MSAARVSIPASKRWIKAIKKGDVLKSKSGALRIVRRVSHSGPSVPKTSVYFAIMHCSWTHRCYTVYTGNDLVQMGYSPVPARDGLRGKIDRQIEAEFDRDYVMDAVIGCCDVTGVR